MWKLQLCAGLEAGIEGDTHDVGQRRLERLKEIRNGGEDAGDLDGEEEHGGVAAVMGNLNIDMAGTEEEGAEGITEALDMEVEKDRGIEGEEEGGETQRELGALEFLTQEAEPSGTTLVDDRNGFNKLSRLAML